MRLWVDVFLTTEISASTVRAQASAQHNCEAMAWAGRPPTIAHRNGVLRSSMT